MARATSNESQDSPLKRKLWRQWAVLSVLWIVIALSHLIANWQEIYPKRPFYLLVPNQSGETLDTWYTTDAQASVQAFKRRHRMADAEEIRVGENVLLLPKGAAEQRRAFFLEKAEAMRLTLDERFVRTIVYRFVPMVLLFILGPPFALILLGRLAFWAMRRFVGGT